MTGPRVPCPNCTDGFVTTGDRHARTAKDVCPHCAGTGMVAARTGETPEASFRPPPAGAFRSYSSAVGDIIAERQRQMAEEGWTPEHDDGYAACELAEAAACYALAPSPVGIEREWVYPDVPKGWPWHRSWWKPSFYRRNLVKACALLLAEIERWDRATLAAQPPVSPAPAEGV